MAVQHDHCSPEEYLEIDRTSLDIKYEYEDGQMYAMSGGTVEHAQIAQNMIAALAAHFGEGPCRAFSSDVRVQVSSKKILLPTSLNSSAEYAIFLMQTQRVGS